MALADRFIALAESGNQQRVRCLDGRVLQGWIMEVTDQDLVISVGGGETGQDHRIPFDQLDPEALAYWDSRSQGWQTFTL